MFDEGLPHDISKDFEDRLTSGILSPLLVRVRQFDVPEYRRCLQRLRELAAEVASLDPANDWPVQLVDYFAWEHDAATSKAG